LNTFEYAMVLISIIVGVGITHILSALGAAVPSARACCSGATGSRSSNCSSSGRVEWYSTVARRS
jgi:hypothetical protein